MYHTAIFKMEVCSTKEVILADIGEQVSSGKMTINQAREILGLKILKENNSLIIEYLDEIERRETVKIEKIYCSISNDSIFRADWVYGG